MLRQTQSARNWLLLVAFCVVLAVAKTASAAGFELSDPCPPTPLEAEILADAGGGQFSRHTLIEATLVAGGIDRTDLLQTYRRKYETFRDAARTACRGQEAPRDRAQVVLEFMHREILTGGYDPSASQMSRLLDDGKFNCVSATVLFHALAADCGLTVRATELPTHVYSVVAIADQSLIIETTCATWFRMPQQPRPMADAAGDATVGRDISPAGLVAVIYYNRGIEALSKSEFAAAVSANLRALRLDATNAPARGNLLAALNNWALAQCADGNYSEAVALLDQGRQLDAEHQPFLLNRRHVYRLWIESLIAAGRSQDAATVLVAARNADQDCPLWETYAGRIGFPRVGL